MREIECYEDITMRKLLFVYRQPRIAERNAGNLINELRNRHGAGWIREKFKI